ncbi:ATP-grasp domain-containing protein [Streptomyces sp. SID3212]|uniref:ATP-grasp domain-containing protein n=1 Tax=Streptomyces sp. SID3212 TaxID=2690259 RepID=UPI00136FDED3|nr:ATP-grasp domain-containing protein [Streptomyces sp. SID3212]
MTPLPPHLLFVGGASPLASSLDIVTAALTQARARGIRTHVTGRSEVLAATPAVTELADEVSPVDPDDPVLSEAWARRRLAAGDSFDLVLGLRDPVQLSVARCAAVAGAPGNTTEAVRRVRDKDACRAALAAAGFRQPRVRLCAGLGQAEAFLAESYGPWVVKPRDGMGSVGVRKVTGPADLPRAVEELPTSEPFLVEEFVEGPEFSVEGVLLQDGPKVLAITAKEKLPPPYFVEIGHVLPAELSDIVRREVEDEVVRALTALDLRFGVFHAELWVTDAGIVLGEVHTRPGGDWLHLLLSHAIPGLELFGLLYDDALGRDHARDLTPTRAAAVAFLAPEPGRLVEVTGWERVLAHPAVLRAELGVVPGDVIAPVRNSGDRAGFVVVGGATPREARELAAEVTALLSFEVEPAAVAVSH